MLCNGPDSDALVAHYAKCCKPLDGEFQLWAELAICQDRSLLSVSHHFDVFKAGLDDISKDNGLDRRNTLLIGRHLTNDDHYTRIIANSAP